MRDLPIVKIYQATDIIRLLVLSSWDPLHLQTNRVLRAKLIWFDYIYRLARRFFFLFWVFPKFRIPFPGWTYRYTRFCFSKCTCMDIILYLKNPTSPPFPPHPSHNFSFLKLMKIYTQRSSTSCHVCKIPARTRIYITFNSTSAATPFSFTVSLWGLLSNKKSCQK